MMALVMAPTSPWTLRLSQGKDKPVEKIFGNSMFGGNTRDTELYVTYVRVPPRMSWWGWFDWHLQNSAA